MMEIILMCENSSGSVAFSAGLVEGLPAPTRKYMIVGGKITLSGFSDAILQHDCEELLHMPSGLYRMPTPGEQEQMAQAAQQASMIQEADSPAPTDPDPEDEPPAQSKKKASGG